MKRYMIMRARQWRWQPNIFGIYYIQDVGKDTGESESHLNLFVLENKKFTKNDDDNDNNKITHLIMLIMMDVIGLWSSTVYDVYW